jgi:alkylation response protein AidB-like acyl-CoA dehydrogenase
VQVYNILGQLEMNHESASFFTLDQAVKAIWPPTEHLLSETVAAAIAETASAADEAGVLSGATVDLLREAGYFGLPVPAALDGRGAGLLECAAVQRRLAQSDPAVAIAGNMHLFSVGMSVEHWLRRKDSCGLLLNAIAQEHLVLASAFAEPDLGGKLLRSNVKATRSKGGYMLRGVKSPCSLAAHCNLISLQMQAEPPEAKGLMLAVIPATAPGIRVESTWDALGMRASGSETLRLEDCFVPDELIFHRCEPGFDDDPIFAAGLVWFCALTTATYLGVVQAAIDAARDGLRRTFFGDVERAASPSAQAALGESLAGALSIEAACAAIAERMDRKESDPRCLVPAALAVKHVAVDACIRAVEGAAELLGAKSYGRTEKLARLWRDVQAARFHPPTRLAARQLLGKWALQLPFSFELDER